MKEIETFTSSAEILNPQTPMQITLSKIVVEELGEWIITGAMLPEIKLIGLPFEKQAVEEHLMKVKRKIHPGLF